MQLHVLLVCVNMSMNFPTAEQSIFYMLHFNCVSWFWKLPPRSHCTSCYFWYCSMGHDLFLSICKLNLNDLDHFRSDGNSPQSERKNKCVYRCIMGLSVPLPMWINNKLRRIVKNNSFAASSVPCSAASRSFVLDQPIILSPKLITLCTISSSLTINFSSLLQYNPLFSAILF